MDSKQAAKLRGWQRKYGAVGVVMAGGCLCWEHWRVRIRVRPLLCAALLLIGVMLLWPRPTRDASRPLAAPIISADAQHKLDARLIAAVKSDNLAKVRVCLQQGANVNAADSNGEPALALACTDFHPDTCAGYNPGMLLTLLVRGANPNVRVSAYIDFNSDHKKSVPLLIQALRVFNRTFYDETTCRTLVRTMLDRGADIHLVDAEGNTALIAAIEAQEPEIAQWLIARGADINRANRSGVTPLYLVPVYDYGKNKPALLNTLLQRGVDVTPAHNKGWNILCWAASRDDARVAGEVIRRGVDVNSRDERQRTPLMYAAAGESGRVLSVLLSRGADVNARDELGWTALMFAAQSSDCAIVNTLLQHGADRQARDRENHWTAEQRARRLGQEQTADLLRTGCMAASSLPSATSVFENDTNALPAPSKHVPIDAYRWIETVHVPNIPQEGGEGACGVVIADDKGRRGKPFGGETFFFRPDAQVFRDVDGRSYAFIKGHHRAENNFVAAIRGRTFVKKAECYARYNAVCQPLPVGGALITVFDRTRDMEGVPAGHLGDEVREVSRFQNGKLTRLGFLIEPSQSL